MKAQYLKNVDRKNEATARMNGFRNQGNGLWSHKSGMAVEVPENYSIFAFIYDPEAKIEVVSEQEQNNSNLVDSGFGYFCKRSDLNRSRRLGFDGIE